MRLTVLGCGRWASFLGWYGDYTNHDVLIWGRSSSKNLKELRETRCNQYIQLDESIILSDSLEEAIAFSDTIIVSISAQKLRDLCINMNQYDLTGKTLVLAMKGIEKSTGLRLSEVVKSVLNQDVKVAIWVGPGHVQAFANNIPNCMLISSDDKDVTDAIIERFNSKLIRLYKNDDLIGNEIGAASKNVIGIAAGMLDGLEYSSLKGALIARGSREMARLIKAMGGQELTAYGLCHIGDYEATLFSEYSNNRSFGEKYIRKECFDKLAEGVSTTESLLKLSEKYEVDLPITRAVYKIIINKMNPEEVLRELLIRDVKPEF